MTLHSILPWKPLQGAYRWFRRTFFTKPAPGGTYIVVDPITFDDPIDIELGQFSFAPNWEQSYNMRGEDFNVARVVQAHHIDYPGVVWWQCHLRGWYYEDKLYLSAHWEPEPIEHPEAHLNADGFNAERGRSILKTYLDRLEIPYQEQQFDGDF